VLIELAQLSSIQMKKQMFMLNILNDESNIASLYNFVDSLTTSTTKKTSLLLFMSPDAILNRKWIRLIDKLKTKDLVKLVVFDEAHYILQSGRCFRSTYYTNVHSLEKKVLELIAYDVYFFNVE